MDQYQIAKGQDGQKTLEKKFAQLLRFSRESLTKSTHYDILFNLGDFTSLIRVEMGKKPIKFSYSDFEFGRAAPKPVKDAVINFIKSTLEEDKKTETVSDEEILAVHFYDHSLEKNRVKQKAAGFYDGGLMDIKSDHSNRADTITEVKIQEALSSVQQLGIPKFDERKTAFLLQAQKELDSLISPANEYAKGGKHKATLFVNQTDKGKLPEGEVPSNSKSFGKNG
jgi:hypothetical protein